MTGMLAPGAWIGLEQVSRLAGSAFAQHVNMLLFSDNVFIYETQTIPGEYACTYQQPESPA